jgi:lysozyme
MAGATGNVDMVAFAFGRQGRPLASLSALVCAMLLSSPVEARTPFPKKGDAEPHHGVRDAKQKTIQGIDVSRWQQDIDWDRVKSAGTRFAFIKATEGGDLLDRRFRENWDGARAAGVPRGAYHFVFWCRPARDQIRWFIRNVPKEPQALPPVLDVEWNNHSSCARTEPAKARQKMREMLRAFEAHYGKKPIIYTDINFHADVLEGTVEFDDYPFWIRSTAARPEKRYENRPWEFWQFTTTGRVPGITGDVDRNAFFGSEKQFTDWIAGRYDIGARRPMNANSRIAQPVPVDPIPRRPAQASGAATPLLSIPMDLRPPRSGGMTGSIVRSSEGEQR